MGLKGAFFLQMRTFTFNTFGDFPGNTLHVVKSNKVDLLMYSFYIATTLRYFYFCLSIYMLYYFRLLHDYIYLTAIVTSCSLLFYIQII